MEQVSLDNKLIQNNFIDLNNNIRQLISSLNDKYEDILKSNFII